MSEANKRYEPDNIPKQITRELYVNYGIGKYNSGRIAIDDYEKSTNDPDFAFVELARTTVTLNLPKCRVDVKSRLLEVLEDKKQKIIAENHMRLKQVQDEIDNLLALEFKEQHVEPDWETVP